MTEVFDWHKWEAETYENPEDIIRAFGALGVCGKIIAGLRIIGHVSHNARLAARRTQHEAGIPYIIIDSGIFTHAYAARTLVPCSVKAIEPMIVTFTDGSTLELQPSARNSLKMSSNQIPPNITNGANYGNFDAKVIFHGLIGETLRSLSVDTFIKENISGPSGVKSTDRFRRYQFWTGIPGNLGFSLTQHGGAWYGLELRDQKRGACEGNEIQKIALRSFNKAFTRSSRILIVEGHDYSSYFWIKPVKILDSPDMKGDDRVYEHSVEEISIEEDNVLEFLYYFLEKHFDSHIQVTECSYRRDVVRCFEWNLEHNIYTYESVKNIIAEIRSAANIFRNDFGNSALSEIKARFSLYTLTDEVSGRHASKISDTRREKLIQKNIGLVLDFYERFCRRMELMMEHAPQYDFISFMGP